ncbi:MAG: M23 family metallopeptidase [Hydrogenoanaerobacterium sp.]
MKKVFSIFLVAALLISGCGMAQAAQTDDFEVIEVVNVPSKNDKTVAAQDAELKLSVVGTPKQGESFLLRVDNLPQDEEVTITAVTDMNFTPTFYPYDGGMVALMPAKYSQDAGEYHITLTCNDVKKDFTINVADANFVVNVQNFAVDKKVADATVNNNKANDDYEKVTRPLKNLGDPEKYWVGKFSLPLKKENISTSSPFGIIRIINGVKDQHAGIDYPAPIGTPVYAPNNGRVLFAGYLQLTGNMVCIEHGFGLKSWYYHMNSVSVKAGDMVKTGDEIGKVGATGFVTGPHLHFTMSINNVYVNPNQYLKNDVLP